jgi:aspartate aminotransferase
MPHSWIAQRTLTFDSSGIRKVFDRAATMKNPINLSIGQPDFDVPEPIQLAAIEAIRSRKNGYSQTQGIAPLREKLQAQVDADFGHADRKLAITSGTSGGLLLAILALVNPGDEVIVFDPFFVMYTALIKIAGGTPVIVDTYPDFRIDRTRLESAITPRTKLILHNSPANPTGALASEAEVKMLAELTAKHNIALISDEIYREFCYEQPLISPAKYNDQTIVIDGFSKTYGITGWRLGHAPGPAEVIETMMKMQQYTFVCAPQPAQWAGIAALDVDMSPYVASYKKRRDQLIDGLSDLFDITVPGGAFYMFPRAPWGTGTEFVNAAIENNLLIIPGNIFSEHDTHFRISYAATEETIAKGIEVLRKVAKAGK